MAGTVISAVIGIWMAFRGYGVWALLTQHLLNSAIDTVIVFFVSGWRPSWDFSVSRLAKLLRFGMGVMAASLADTLYGNLRQLLIGKFHSASSLGFYNKGEQLPNVVTINVNSPLQTALYPVLSVSQHDTVKVRAMLKRSIEVSAYISAPLMAGLAVIASQAVRLLMTDKWLPCVPYVYVFCFVYFLFPIQESFHSAVKALGKSSLYFRTELLKKTIGVLLLVITIQIGSFAVCLSLIPYVLIVQIIDGYLIGSLLDFRISEQLRSILPPVILAVLMSACIIPAAMLGLPPAATILLQVLSGATVYIAVSALLHFESYLYLKDILTTLLRR
jgi:O-antigen/teichoic acid export membrane protein